MLISVSTENGVNSAPKDEPLFIEQGNIIVQIAAWFKKKKKMTARWDQEATCSEYFAFCASIHADFAVRGS